MSEVSKRKHQVFISSTFSDLEDERFAVMKAIMGIDCIPAGMEDFPAFDEAQLTYIKRVIDESDYYILIIGGRYGSLDEEGVSFTEREYRYAKGRGKPILAFIHSDTDSLSLKNSEKDPDNIAKLSSFRDEVSKNRIVKYWSRPEELPGQALIALNQATKLMPQIGWVRGDSLEVEDLVSELSQRRQENQILKSEIERRDLEIEELRDVLGRDADDASGLYSRAEAILESEAGAPKGGDRESIRLLLERILQLALQLQVSVNDLFNSGVLATRADLDYLALQFHTLACYLLDSKSHWMAMLHREAAAGVSLNVVSTERGLEVKRNSEMSPQDIRSRALKAALEMFAEAPVAQCEIIYSQAWNICQTHRETDALEIARELLISSYLARRDQIDEIQVVETSEFGLNDIDWSQQVGRPVPSYMLQKIAEISQFLAKSDWLEETKKWLRLAERQNAIEPPNATWYRSTVKEIDGALNAIQLVEARVAQEVEI